MVIADEISCKNMNLINNKIMAVEKEPLKDPLLTMTLCAPNEKQDKGNLGQKGLSDNTKGLSLKRGMERGMEWGMEWVRGMEKLYSI